MSHLTASPSRDLIRAAHQQITQDWWAGRNAFELYVSQAVLREISRGDPGAAADRLAAVRFLPVLAAGGEAESLAGRFMGRGGLPPKAAVDAIHIAVAAANGMDCLLTWNCTHIANACTPEELMEV
ncbi:MAG: type II toxin-antitoxin system VapC family toxin [Deltaproteobacteria bacterium]|nr:type II toxin-antitoxin system VapC family toxin [Deltaproteobacteria bacterium]